jgi:hypothetical protein
MKWLSEMPEDEEVLYPPIQVSAERLRRLTPQRGWKSASTERHAEAARYAEEDDQ